ncbi:calcium-transporting ATPase 4, plasma membrane-type-like isoform X6 [Gastrolobium bilobum]|uniref:calcium-transporting ATPase 4, plasma membrane-type-like isoform X6 n=1 Tax=Gastrolobium bilobum TaxID=150636 RepID=UPI002AB2F8C0|nr:calcium-transporting ATPase 4, plasma membrane-type-like isoform X6 [Gastrolobium bilobum]
MEKHLLKDFELDPKNPSVEALQRWRSAVTLVKNRRRRFRMVADLDKRSQAEQIKQGIKEKIRIALYVQKAALQFIDGMALKVEYKPSEEAREAGFGIHPDDIASIVRSHDYKNLNNIGGVEAIARKLTVSVDGGVSEESINRRQQIYGVNRYTEKPSRTFLMFVWDAMQDLTLIILMVCAIVSIGVGIATEGWPKGTYDGVGIILSIFLVVIVTAVSDYKQSLQFRDLDKEKKKIFVQVIRDGKRQKISIYDIVVGDIVHLSTGDQVPADGIYISGYFLLIDESSLSGESEPVNANEEKPFLLSGTKVQDGQGVMLVTAVGMRTEWGKLMETLNEGGDDETPLQVKLNGVATIIGKIGLAFAVLTFLVLTIRFMVEKALNGEFGSWSSKDAMKLLDYFAIAVTIIVVAVPEGLPLAVTLSLAFAMKKLMNDRALVRHLSACETMGSASCICTDKTGTLTTNRMVVNKIWICDKATQMKGNETADELKTKISEGVVSILLQAIFQNTSAEVVKDKDGNNTTLGTPTESALLEFGLLFGADFDAQRRAYKILQVEPFNSVRKKMSVLVGLPDGGVQAFCKGASEIVLKMCDKIIDCNGEVVDLPEDRANNVSDVINGFASEALRTLCLAGGVAIEGPDFRDLSPEQMKDIIPRIQVMARSLPLDKHKLVTNLRNMFGEVVAVTGDGTNDAPALHEADIGLAMGIAGTEVAKEKADVVIMDDNFTTIINVAKWGRAVYINIQKFVQFQLTVNVVALIINFFSACITGSAPLTAVQLLWVNLIMDTLGALALATEPPNDGLLQRPPVGRGTSFITKPMWRNIIGQSIYQLIVLAILNFDGKRLLRISGSDATEVLNTLIFNSFVFCQVFNEINSRDIEKINIFRGMFDSWIFLLIIFATVVFQVVIVEFLGAFASTVPLNWQMWLLSVLIGAVSMPIAAILKCIPVEKDTSKHHDGYEPLPSGPELA